MQKNSANKIPFPQACSRESLLCKRLPYSSRLAIILTDKCNIQCRHCLSDCAPTKENRLDKDLVERLIEESAEIGIKTICFTGGEPFLDMDMLRFAFKKCKFFRLDATVISNGFWARSVKQASSILKSLEGHIRLGLSVDHFHQEFIPIEWIQNAIIACNELGIESSIRISHLNNPEAEIENIRQQLGDIKGLYEIEFQPIQRSGRAVSNVNINSIFTYDTSLAMCRSADTHAVNVDGSVTACCGTIGYWQHSNHMLNFGNVKSQSLKEILRSADNNPALHALRLWGPWKLFCLVLAQAEYEGSPITPPKFGEICTLCEYVVADPELCELLRRALQNPQVCREIAVARMMDLGEVSMFLALENE